MRTKKIVSKGLFLAIISCLEAQAAQSTLMTNQSFTYFVSVTNPAKIGFSLVVCFKAATASKRAGACQGYSTEDTPTVFGAISISETRGKADTRTAQPIRMQG